MHASELRRSYLSFFEKAGHPIVPSSPLIPQGDPSLLFTSAGMVPFKPYFLGLKTDLKRAASCQKSFRTTDIERVGATIRHLTFFEMLGNFSFGDYFKAEAIDWCWTYLTREAKLDPKRLHVSVFKDDAEAMELWRKFDLKNPIVKLDEETNFWTMGPTGPCGPCSEVYFDRGAEHGCGRTNCGVGCDCDRYLEIWNLVFTQFDRQEDGSLKPLPRKNIDTGMGLERLALVVQDKRSPFETDLFWPIMEKAAGLLETLPGKTPETKRIFRILGDHGRAAAFLAAEGIVPSNEGRGYILRRLIRRALSQGSLLIPKKKAFVHELAASASDLFGPVYPELKKNRSALIQTVKQEEEIFLETLETGEERLKLLAEEHPVELPGEEAFKLYDTYGFPLELTVEILGRQSIAVDRKGYEAARLRAQEAARKGWKGSGEKARSAYERLHAKRSFFLGYELLDQEATVLVMLDGQGRELESATAGQEAEVILDKTPFYPEGGGQVGDRGWFEDSHGRRVAEVLDTQKPLEHLIVHKLRVLAPLRRGELLKARVDPLLRRASAAHHTGTHLLNEALRRVLGPGVRQAGSYVAPDRLRFDFTFPRALDLKELETVEGIVNAAIENDYAVQAQERAAGEAERLGALTLVGESYGEKPRFVLIGGDKGEDPWKHPLDRFSLELCGGTHCRNTSEVRVLKILKDSSIASGTRRIEAVAGPAAVKRLALLETHVHRLESKLQVPLEQLEGKVEQLMKTEKELRGEIGRLKERLVSGGAVRAEESLKEVEGVRLFAQKLQGVEMNSLRSLSDRKKKELGSGVVFLASSDGGRLSFVVALSPDLQQKGLNASLIAKRFAQAVEGSAGGRPDFAQGGGKDSAFDQLLSRLEVALKG